MNSKTTKTTSMTRALAQTQRAVKGVRHDRTVKVQLVTQATANVLAIDKKKGANQAYDMAVMPARLDSRKVAIKARLGRASLAPSYKEAA